MAWIRRRESEEDEFKSHVFKAKIEFERAESEEAGEEENGDSSKIEFENSRRDLEHPTTIVCYSMRRNREKWAREGNLEWHGFWDSEVKN